MQTLEMVMSGALDMSLVGNAIIESYCPDFAILSTPYLFDSLEHQEHVFENGSDALAVLYATTEANGFTVLSAYSLGARNLYTRDGPVTTPEDLAGKKIRVMGSETCLNMINAMGGVSVAMAYGDVYSAIQTKTLDGSENNIITYMDLLQYKVAPYYNLTGHLILPDELVISNAVLESMSKEDQAALRRVCRESIPYCYSLVSSLNATYLARAEDMGVTVSAVDSDAFRARCQNLISAAATKSDVTQALYTSIMALR